MSNFKTIEKVLAEKIVWVKGMSGSERRLAFRRGDLAATRENPAAYTKHVEPVIAEGNAYTWFHHGLLDVATGNHVKDPNFSEPTLEALYEERWGVAPSGDFYDAVFEPLKLKRVLKATGKVSVGI